MLRALLYVQWKTGRWLLVPLVLLSVGLPLLMVASIRRFTLDGNVIAPTDLLGVEESVLGLFPALAAAIGFVVGLAVWHWDHRLGHVYALSLPVSRAGYVLLRFAAGAVLLLVPVAALWAGAFTAALTTPLPAGLHAYPLAFGLRFLLAALIAYATTFALAAGTMRTTLVMVSALVLFLVFGGFLVDVLERAAGGTGWFRPVDVLDYMLVRWPGPFHVFGGSWLLIDV